MHTQTLSSQDVENRAGQQVKHNNYFNIQENQDQETSPLIFDLSKFYSDLEKCYNFENEEDNEEMIK